MIEEIHIHIDSPLFWRKLCARPEHAGAMASDAASHEFLQWHIERSAQRNRIARPLAFAQIRRVAPLQFAVHCNCLAAANAHLCWHAAWAIQLACQMRTDWDEHYRLIWRAMYEHALLEQRDDHAAQLMAEMERYGGTFEPHSAVTEMLAAYTTPSTMPARAPLSLAQAA